MCGPSSAMKSLNSQMTSLATSMAGEAKTVFGTINTSVQKILSSVSNIIAGGPSQMGMSQAELNAKRAFATEAGGAEARNLRGAALSSGAAIGGGNVSLPSGAAGQLASEASIRAAQDTAAAQNQITQQGFDIGRENYWKGIQTAETAPGAYGTANAFNTSAVGATQSAEQSQQSLDAMKGWWKPLVMKLGTGLLGAATGGISNAITSGVGKLFGGGGTTSSDVLSLPSSGGESIPSPFNMVTDNTVSTGMQNLASLFPSSNPTIPNYTGSTGSSGGGIGG